MVFDTIDTMFVWHFIDPGLRVEIFFELGGGRQGGVERGNRIKGASG